MTKIIFNNCKAEGNDQAGFSFSSNPGVTIELNDTVSIANRGPGYEVRDSILEHLGLSPDTPKELLMDFVRSNSVLPKDKLALQKIVGKSKLPQFLQVGADISTLSSGLHSLYASLPMAHILAIIASL